MTVGSKGDPEFIGVLRELSGRIGAEYVEGELRQWSPVQSHGRVLARAGPWIITIGIFTCWHTKYVGSTWTEVHAPYVRPGGLRFTIVPAGFLGRFFKKLGLLPIVDVGFRDFDEAFCVKATDAEAVKSLFADGRLRRLFLAQPSLTMEVYDRSMPWAFALGSLRDVPDHLALLYCREGRAILDVERLKGLFDVTLAVLERSCEVGSALREPPGVEVRGRMGTPPVLTSPSDQGAG
jgi:hypothetical protein